MSGMPRFDGRRDQIGWTEATIDAAWSGQLLASRDGNTIGLALDLTRATWGAGALVGALPQEFWPIVTRRVPATNRSSFASVWLSINPANGQVSVLTASTVGLLGDITFIR